MVEFRHSVTLRFGGEDSEILQEFVNLAGERNVQVVRLSVHNKFAEGSRATRIGVIKGLLTDDWTRSGVLFRKLRISRGRKGGCYKTFQRDMMFLIAERVVEAKGGRKSTGFNTTLYRRIDL